MTFVIPVETFGLGRFVKSGEGSHVMHKYISKRPDGKGSWIYTYRRPDGSTYTSGEKPKRDLKQWGDTVRGARARLKAQMAAHPEGGTKEHHAKLADLAKQEAYVKKMRAAGHTHAEEDGHHESEAASPKSLRGKIDALREMVAQKSRMPTREERLYTAADIDAITGYPGSGYDGPRDALVEVALHLPDAVASHRSGTGTATSFRSLFDYHVKNARQSIIEGMNLPESSPRHLAHEDARLLATEADRVLGPVKMANGKTYAEGSFGVLHDVEQEVKRHAVNKQIEAQTRKKPTPEKKPEAKKDPDEPPPIESVGSEDPEVEKLYREGFSREEAAKRIEKKVHNAHVASAGEAALAAQNSKLDPELHSKAADRYEVAASSAEKMGAKETASEYRKRALHHKLIAAGETDTLRRLADGIGRSVYHDKSDDPAKLSTGTKFAVVDGIDRFDAGLGLGETEQVKKLAAAVRAAHPDLASAADSMERRVERRDKEKREAEEKRAKDRKFGEEADLEQLATADHAAFSSRVQKHFDAAKASKNPEKMVEAANQLGDAARALSKHAEAWGRHRDYTKQSAYISRASNLRKMAEELRTHAQKLQRTATTKARKKATAEAMVGDHKPGTVKDKKFHLALIDGPKLHEATSVHGDYAVHKHIGGDEHGYQVTHVPTGMSVSSTVARHGEKLSKKSAESLARLMHEHAPGIMGTTFGSPVVGPGDREKANRGFDAWKAAETAARDDERVARQKRAGGFKGSKGVAQALADSDEEEEPVKKSAKRGTSPMSKAGDMDAIDDLGTLVKAGGGERAGHKYISRKADGGGHYTYVYAHPTSGEHVKITAHPGAAVGGVTTHAHVSTGTIGGPGATHHTPVDDSKKTGYQGLKSSHAAGTTVRGTDDEHVKAMLTHAAQDAHVEHIKRENKGRAKRGLDAIAVPEKVKKSEGETTMSKAAVPSTPEIRRAFRGLDGNEPLAKGLYKFNVYKDTPSHRLPEEYLPAYLDSFIEEATEHEMREKAHSLDAMTMGPTPGDPADAIAQFVMNELVAYMACNENLLSAVKLVNATRAYIADRIRDMGILKPLASHRQDHGDFLQGYMYSEAQEVGYVGKSGHKPAPGTVLDEEEMLKGLAHTRSAHAASERVVRFQGEDPMFNLGEFHRSQRRQVMASYGEGPVTQDRAAANQPLPKR